MRDYEKTEKINQIINNIKHFIQIGDELLPMVEKGSKCVLVCDPESLRWMISRLSECWGKIIEDIQDTDPQFLDKLSECIQWMDELVEVYCEAYNRYELFGPSGNLADFSGLCYLQVMYRERWGKIWHASVRLIDELEERLEELKHVTSMSIVYAPPELMKGSIFVDDIQEQYPFIHAESLDDKNHFDDCYMKEVYGSPEMLFDIFDDDYVEDVVSANEILRGQGIFCVYCGEKYASQNRFCTSCGKQNIEVVDPEATVKFCKTCGRYVPIIAKYCSWCGNLADISENMEEPAMGFVYASPQLMSDSSKPPKTNIFSKIFKRKNKDGKYNI